MNNVNKTKRYSGLFLSVLMSLSIGAGFLFGREVNQVNNAMADVDYGNTETGTFSNTNSKSGIWTASGGTPGNHYVLPKNATITSSVIQNVNAADGIKITINMRTYGGTSYKNLKVQLFSKSDFSDSISGEVTFSASNGSTLADVTNTISYTSTSYSGDTYIRVLSGSSSTQYGPSVAAITAQYNSGTITSSYTINFNGGEGGTGSMASLTKATDKAVTLPKNTFLKSGYDFTNWSGSDGQTYNDQATISANTFNNGDVLNLTANWSVHTYNDALSLNNTNRYIRVGTNVYIKNTINTTAGKPAATTNKADAQIFKFILVDDEGFNIQAVGGSHEGKYLTSTTSTASGSQISLSNTAKTWYRSNNGTSNSYLYFKNGSSNYYLAANSTTDWRVYTNTNNGTQTFTFEDATVQPSVSGVTINGTVASKYDQGSSFTLSATVNVSNDPNNTLNKNVNWSVSPSGAVSFSATSTTSGSDVRVTVGNINQSSVTITATSVADSSKSATTSAFAIEKIISIDSVSLTSKSGETSFDAKGDNSVSANFNSVVSYTSDAGTGEVNITVSPSTATINKTNPFVGGDFSITFKNNGTYVITSASDENPLKTATLTVTVSNIVKTGYQLLTDLSLLKNNSQFLIYSAPTKEGNSGYIMSSAANTNNIKANSYTATDGFISEDDVKDNWQVVTATITTGGYYLKINDTQYLTCSGDSNTLTQVSSNQCSFSITLDGNNAHITPNNYTNRYIMYNSSNSVFACYTGTQNEVQIYLLPDNSPFYSINKTTDIIGIRGVSQLSVEAHNGASATIAWSITSGSEYVTIESNDNSVRVSGLAVGEATVTASFTNGYESVSCVVKVLKLDDYVTVGVTEFNKATSASDWSGTYLIGHSSNNVILQGGSTPFNTGYNNVIELSNFDSKITSTTLTLANIVNIKKSSDGTHYVLKTASNFYIGQSNNAQKNGIEASYENEYLVDISSSGVISTTGTTKRSLAYDVINKAIRFFENITTTIINVELFKANGEVRAISSTIESFYDNSKNNLICYDVSKTPGKTSIINWSAIQTEFNKLDADDKATLRDMNAKASEDNGNYLEAFISKYDYCVAKLHYTDFIGRKEAGTLSVSETYSVLTLELVDTSNYIVVLTLIISSLAIGGYYYLLRKKKYNK